MVLAEEMMMMLLNNYYGVTVENMSGYWYLEIDNEVVEAAPFSYLNVLTETLDCQSPSLQCLVYIHLRILI